MFKIEYSGVYQGFLNHLELYFKMESKILEYGLEDEDHQLQSVPLLKTDFCSSFIIDEDRRVLKHSALLIDKITSLNSALPFSLQKNNYQEELLKGPNNRRFRVQEFFIYKTPIKNTEMTFITLIDKRALEKQAFIESADTLLSIIILLTFLIILVHFLIRKEFIRPAQDLVHHLEQESQGVSDPPQTHKDWQPWINSITHLFSENRRLIADLEDHIKNLDLKVLERTEEIQLKNVDLETAISHLKEAQNQIILQEKMASLGSLTAGIAHEMKNPLNFIISFSEVSQELMHDLLEALNLILEKTATLPPQEIMELAQDLRNNMNYIREHGQRADHIVRSMLLHAHGGSAEKHLIDINELLKEHADLAISGFKGLQKNFYVKLKTQLDLNQPQAYGVTSDIGRVFLNIINNACYAIWDKKIHSSSSYEPSLFLSTRELENTVEIRIRDNGPGLPDSIKHKIFEPFFTTKPSGKGTGLGLSMCYEVVVKHHGGTIAIDSEIGQYTEFIIALPKES